METDVLDDEPEQNQLPTVLENINRTHTTEQAVRPQRTRKLQVHLSEYEVDPPQSSIPSASIIANHSSSGNGSCLAYHIY